MKNLAKTIIIPHGCVENLLDFSDLPDGLEWFGNGIVMSAIAHHVPGYIINYPKPRKHVIMYCRSGAYAYVYGSVKGELKAGELFAMPAGKLQLFKAMEPSDCVFFLVRPQDSENNLSFTHKPSPNLQIIFILMETALHGRYNSTTGPNVRRNIANLIVSIVKQDIAVQPEYNEPSIDKLLAKLRLRPERDWTIRHMAEACGLSPSYFFSVCKQQTGKSPYQLLTQIRMELAQTLLTRTDYPINVIASQCGYVLPFSFTRTFTKHFGISPQEYRKTN